LEEALNLSLDRLLMMTHKKEESNEAPLLPPDSPDDLGKSCLRDCLIESMRNAT